jgi:signal transduction histidine kinase
MAKQLKQQLASELADDPASARLLDQLEQAESAWKHEALPFELAQARALPPRSVLLPEELTGKALFDTLREAIGDLSTRINVLAAAEVARINSAQATANVLTAGAGVAGLVLVFGAGLMLRNSLSRPLTSLVAEVKRVAEGDLGHSVDVAGPAELATVAAAVETMRVRIIAQTARAMEIQRQLDLTEESERIAGGLQDLVIRRLSGAGLVLQSTASRYPATAAVVSGAVDEIDKAIRELRAVVFGLTAGRATGGLRKRVLNLVSESEPSLGFTPHLQFDGILSTGVTGNVSDGLVAALREILSNIASQRQANEAEIRVTVSNGVLRLRVSDNGQAADPQTDHGHSGNHLSGLAERLGGTCTTGSRPGGGTTIEWVVPARGAGPDDELAVASSEQAQLGRAAR